MYFHRIHRLDQRLSVVETRTVPFQHGLDKNNLERLRFYAVVKPEKLDKSFRYMAEKVARYLRHRNKP